MPSEPVHLGGVIEQLAGILYQDMFLENTLLEYMYVCQCRMALEYHAQLLAF